MKQIVYYISVLLSAIFFIAGYFNLREGLRTTKGRGMNIKQILSGQIDKVPLKKGITKIILAYIFLAMSVIF